MRLTTIGRVYENYKHMKKVLVITYYWPPSGGGGVQRWLKFTKYLPEFGWTPIVYTPEIQNAPAYDESLLKDVSNDLEIIRKPIWEPYAIYKLLTGRKKKENLGAAFASGKHSNKMMEHVSNWVRSNFFIPDARKFWIKPSVKFLKKYIKTNGIEVIVTTGPPHSMHLIGLKLKELTGVKWLADFRDPWTDIDFYDQLKLTGWADNRHHYLEKVVLQNADLVISISESNKRKLMEKADASVEVITNGFDESDFPDIEPTLDDKFTIAHIGTFMANRNPNVLWKVLSELVLENHEFNKDFELHLVGKTDAFILDTLNQRGLSDFVRSTGAVTHNEAIQFQKNSQVLLITVNKTGDSKGMVTGKIFEYLISGRPVLAIGPEDGDLANILKDTGAGVISDFENKIDLKRNIQTFYREYKNKTLKVDPRNLDIYSRKNLTKKMAGFLDTLV